MAEQGGDDGSRVMGLDRPFTAAGRRIDRITFAPMTYGHLRRWQAGAYTSADELLMELTDLKLHEIEQIRRPDDERMFSIFLNHVHPEIAENIAEGVVPVATPGAYDRPRSPPVGEFEDEAPQGPKDTSRATAAAEAALARAGQEFPDGAPASYGEAFGGAERPADYIEGLDT